MRRIQFLIFDLSFFSKEHIVALRRIQHAAMADLNPVDLYLKLQRYQFSTPYVKWQRLISVLETVLQEIFTIYPNTRWPLLFLEHSLFRFDAQEESERWQLLIQYPTKRSHWSSITSSAHCVGMAQFIKIFSPSFRNVIMFYHIGLFIHDSCTMHERRNQQYNFCQFLFVGEYERSVKLGAWQNFHDGRSFVTTFNSAGISCLFFYCAGNFDIVSLLEHALKQWYRGIPVIGSNRSVGIVNRHRHVSKIILWNFSIR